MIETGAHNNTATAILDVGDSASNMAGTWEIIDAIDTKIPPRRSTE